MLSQTPLTVNVSELEKMHAIIPPTATHRSVCGTIRDRCSMSKFVSFQSFGKDYGLWKEVLEQKGVS